MHFLIPYNDKPTGTLKQHKRLLKLGKIII